MKFSRKITFDKWLSNIPFFLSASAFGFLNIACFLGTAFGAVLWVAVIGVISLFVEDAFSAFKKCLSIKRITFIILALVFWMGSCYNNLLIYPQHYMEIILEPVTRHFSVYTMYTVITVTLGICSFYFVSTMAGAVCQMAERQQIDLCCDKISRDGRVLVLLLIISFIFLLFTAPLSPVLQSRLSGDEAIFAMMGKGWAMGKIPYRDLFDHKGPFIFLIYAISYKVFGNTLGVFILHIIALWISLYISYRIVRLADGATPIYSCVSVLFVLLYLLHTSGNMARTEMFNLPFLMGSMYYIVKYLKDIKQKHCYIAAFVYGITVAISIMLRATNCVTVCTGIACVFVCLIVNKKFAQLAMNILFGVLGFLSVTAPFVLYFALNDALYDMVWGTLLFNMSYATNVKAWTFRDILNTAFWLLPIIVCFISIFKEKSISMRLFIIISGLLTAYVVSSGYRYEHYFILSAVYIPITFLVLADSVNPLCSDGQENVCSVKALPLLLCGILICNLFGFMCVKFLVRNSQGDLYFDAAKKQVALIPESERNSVIAYNVRADWYFETGIMPCYKYFTIQDFQSSNSIDMVNENVEFYNSRGAKWLVVFNGVWHKSVANAMLDNYDIYNREDAGDGTLILLHSKE